jgi:hypothetical protein
VYSVCEDVIWLSTGFEERQTAGTNGVSTSHSGEIYHDAAYSLQGNNLFLFFYVDNFLND